MKKKIKLDHSRHIWEKPSQPVTKECWCHCHTPKHEEGGFEINPKSCIHCQPTEKPMEAKHNSEYCPRDCIYGTCVFAGSTRNATIRPCWCECHKVGVSTSKQSSPKDVTPNLAEYKQKLIAIIKKHEGWAKPGSMQRLLNEIEKL